MASDNNGNIEAVLFKAAEYKAENVFYVPPGARWRYLETATSPS